MNEDERLYIKSLRSFVNCKPCLQLFFCRDLSFSFLSLLFLLGFSFLYNIYLISFFNFMKARHPAIITPSHALAEASAPLSVCPECNEICPVLPCCDSLCNPGHLWEPCGWQLVKDVRMSEGLKNEQGVALNANLAVCESHATGIS